MAQNLLCSASEILPDKFFILVNAPWVAIFSWTMSEHISLFGVGMFSSEPIFLFCASMFSSEPISLFGVGMFSSEPISLFFFQTKFIKVKHATPRKK